MKKGLITLVTGIFIGATATLAIPAYAAVKQYILTQVNYPIIVNGVEYKDPDRPILNYEGSTYIPLAKIGDLTGVNYKWNDTLKRVEIDNNPVTPAESEPAEPKPKPEDTSVEKKTGCDIAGQKGATLCPDTVIEYPKEPGYYVYGDSEDPSYQMAIALGRKDMPPLMSEGWISEAMLFKVNGATLQPSNDEGGTDLVVGAMWNQTILYTFHFTKEFNDAKDGDFIVDGIRIKKYYQNIFFNIEDLENANVL